MNGRHIRLWHQGKATVPVRGVESSVVRAAISTRNRPRLLSRSELARHLRWALSAGAAVAVLAAPVAPASQVLHDQYDGFDASGATGTPSYTTSFSSATRAADDFVVPAGQVWRVTIVEVRGAVPLDGSQADWFGVSFNRPGGPKNMPWNYIGGWAVQARPGASRYDAVLPLAGTPAEVSLPAGRYWISVSGTTAPGLVGALTPRSPWAWVNRHSVHSAPAALSSHASGPFGAGVTAACAYYQWGRRAADCLIDPLRPDQVFRLRGTVSAAP